MESKRVVIRRWWPWIFYVEQKKRKENPITDTNQFKLISHRLSDVTACIQTTPSATSFRLNIHYPFFSLKLKSYKAIHVTKKLIIKMNTKDLFLCLTIFDDDKKKYYTSFHRFCVYLSLGLVYASDKIHSFNGFRFKSSVFKRIIHGIFSVDLLN